MTNFREIISDAAQAALGNRFQAPQPGHYEAIGRIVNAAKQHRDAVGLSKAGFRELQGERYEQGLTNFRVEFSGAGLGLDNGFKIRAADIPLDLYESAKGHEGDLIVCEIARSPETDGYEVRAFRPFG